MKSSPLGKDQLPFCENIPFFQRVKWATFDRAKLFLMDFEEGLASLSHPGVREFAKNTLTADSVSVIRAIRIEVESEEKKTKHIRLKS